MVDRSAYLKIALEAVELANDHLSNHRELRASRKGDRDYVSNLDQKTEIVVRRYLTEHTPDIGFLGEEQGRRRRDRKRSRWWCLDPIDGTVNFVRGSPFYAVSLALVEDKQPTVGVVSLPFFGVTYQATAGEGALCDGEPIFVSGTTDLRDAVVAIGDYAVGRGSIEENRERIRLTERLANSVLRVRMHGSAAIDLVWLAEGRIDAAIIASTHAWDVAAGVLIAREAGANVTDLTGLEYSTAAASVVATAPDLVDLLGTR